MPLSLLILWDRFLLGFQRGCQLINFDTVKYIKHDCFSRIFFYYMSRIRAKTLFSFNGGFGRTWRILFARSTLPLSYRKVNNPLSVFANKTITPPYTDTDRSVAFEFSGAAVILFGTHPFVAIEFPTGYTPFSIGQGRTKRLKASHASKMFEPRTICLRIFN